MQIKRGFKKKIEKSAGPHVASKSKMAHFVAGSGCWLLVGNLPSELVFTIQ